jgi:hypothetical protein
MKNTTAEGGIATARQPEDASTVANRRRSFLHEKVWLSIGISISVLLPCFWHQRIEAGDLGSHTYNAWLAQLIERGQAPSLYTVQQWNNVLADIVLTRIARVLGFPMAEKIVVGIAKGVFLSVDVDDFFALGDGGERLIDDFESFERLRGGVKLNATGGL